MQPPSFFRVASRKVWPLPTLIFWVIAGVLLAIALTNLREEQRYQLGGAQAVGRVTDKYSRVTGSGRGRSTKYYLDYHFTTQDGFEISAATKVKFSTWESFNPGDSLPVEYLRSEPETNRVLGDTTFNEVATFAGLAAAAFLATGFFFWRNIAAVLGALRIYREGRPGEAKVTDVRQTNMSVNKTRQWRIYYEYQDLIGRSHTGRSDYLPPGEATDWNVGDQCAVRYDQERPERSVWAGREESYGG